MLPVSLRAAALESGRGGGSSACVQLNCELILEEPARLLPSCSAHGRCSGPVEGRAFPCNPRMLWGPCCSGFCLVLRESQH